MSSKNLYKDFKALAKKAEARLSIENDIINAIGGLR